jgi:Ca-activated chloride channel family protein
MTFNPPLIFETYPNPLPNLYLGQQLIVVGRYDENDSVNALFEGEAFGQPQSYTYGINLADSLIASNHFLIKLWAKMKIDHLYIEYFNFSPNSPEAEEIKDEIIDISICYNVLSPFTSFSGGGVTGIEFDEESFENEDQLITYNYPNPFGDITEIHLNVKDLYFGIAIIKIYDMFGRLIHVIELDVAGPGNYSTPWKGINGSGITMPPGHYFYTISYGSNLEKGRMVKH